MVDNGKIPYGIAISHPLTAHAHTTEMLVAGPPE